MSYVLAYSACVSTCTHTHTRQLDESLYEYLLSHNDNDESLALEDGYNLQDAVSRLAHEPQVPVRQATNTHNIGSINSQFFGTNGPSR